MTVPASTTPSSSPPTSPQHIIPSSLTSRRTARMSVRPQPAMAVSTDALIAVVTTALPPLLPLSPLPALLPPPIILPYTRASMVLMRADAPSTYILAPPSRTPPLLTIPLPTLSLPLPLPSNNRKADVLEAMFALLERGLCHCSRVLNLRSRRVLLLLLGLLGTIEQTMRLAEEKTTHDSLCVELKSAGADLATHYQADIDEIYSMEFQPVEHVLMVMTLRTTVSALQTEVGSYGIYRRRQTQLIQILTQKMPPKQTRGRPTPASTTNTTPMIDAAIRALIAQGVADAIAELKA
ncbi:hypothetical protein Tco_0485294 [Tanacetum coccineum]